MKRKILLLAIVAILVFSTFALAACGSSTVKQKLSYGKKYIYDGHLGNDITDSSYYIFYNNGKGVYHYFHQYGGGDIESYSIHFKYVIDSDNEVVYCFYDSFKYDDAHNADWAGNPDQSDWSAVLNFNDKFLYELDAYPHFFVTVEFAKSIPNFGK